MNPVAFSSATLPSRITLGLILLSLALNCASSSGRKGGTTVELYGVVRDREGVGVEGINVFVDDLAWNATDSRGRFRFGVRPGRHRIHLGGFNVRVPSALLDTIVAGMSSTRLDYQYGGLKVVGRLIGPGGTMIREGAVQAYGESPDFQYGIDVGARLDQGRYLLFVPRGVYRFKFRPIPEYYPATEGTLVIPISADTTIDFPARGHLVEGRVSARGHPLQGVTVEAWGVALPDTLETRARNTTGSDGAYRLYLPDGFYVFAVTSGSSLSPFARRWFNHTIGGPERIETTFPMTYWTGIVRDSLTGTPVDSVSIWAGSPGSIRAVSISDRSGRFRLEVEPGQRYPLSWSRGDHGIPRVFAAATANADSMLEVRISRR